jgi:nucleotide-binding universal stress UspA family protein
VYKNILIPTDGTKFCQLAIQHGVSLANLAHAKVTGVTVTLPLHTGTPRLLIPADLLGTIHAETVAAANEKLAVVERAAKAAGVEVETVRKSNDHPWVGIIEAAEEKACDLIVMASHGRRGVSALVLGSETQKVLTHTKIPVLVVR